MTASQGASLLERWSAERMNGYRSAVGGDPDKAVELYKWNIEASIAFWATIHHVEVLVRNAMHQRLTHWSTEIHSEPLWYCDPGNIFTDKSSKSIKKARHKVVKLLRRDETAGRVVAELTLDFWRFLLIPAYDDHLWKPCLRHIWPDQPQRDIVQKKFVILYNLRNRIAHHEPIYKKNLQRTFEDILMLARWTCKDSAAWIRSESRVPNVLQDCPPTRVSRRNKR